MPVSLGSHVLQRLICCREPALEHFKSKAKKFKMETVYEEIDLDTLNIAALVFGSLYLWSAGTLNNPPLPEQRQWSRMLPSLIIAYIVKCHTMSMGMKHLIIGRIVGIARGSQDSNV